MKGFQQIEEHPNHYVFHHDDGHQVHVAKAGLSKRTLQHIQNFAEGGKAQQQQPPAPISQDTAQQFAQGFNSATMAPKPKKMADGGDVQPTPEQQVPAAEVAPQEAPTRDLSSMNGLEQMIAAGKGITETAKNAWNSLGAGGKYLLTGGEPQAQPQQPSQPQGNPNVVPTATEGPKFQQVNLGAPQGQQEQIPLPNYMGKIQQAANQYVGGLGQEAKAEGALGKEQASAYDNEVKQLQDFHTTAQENYKNLDTEIQNIKTDIANSHIDPSRYFSSMGTGQKISTALGLILGGIGGGLTHQENPVLKFINSQIDRDIDTQKAEMGKKENLLGSMYKQYGNMRDAEIAARLHLKAMTEGQLGKLASTAKDPLSKARYQEMAGKFQMDMAPQMSQLAIQQAGFKMLQNPQIQQNPGLAVRFVVPKEQQGEAYKELNGLQAMQKGGSNALRAFDQVSNMALNGAFSPHQKDALIKPVIAQLSKETAGRFTEQDSNMLESLFPNPKDVGSKTALIKRNALIKLLQEKMNSPLLESYGIKLPALTGGRPIPQGPHFQQSGQQMPMMQPTGMNK